MRWWAGRNKMGVEDPEGSTGVGKMIGKTPDKKIALRSMISCDRVFEFKTL
jgi:hypothetical protein